MTIFVRYLVQGIRPEGALARLKQEKIPVFRVEKRDKDRLYFAVLQKDAQKAFAIFEDSCYNIQKCAPFGFARVLDTAKRRIGLLVGCLMFFVLVQVSSPLVLRIDVVGTGSRYAQEVIEILAANGIAPFHAYASDTAAINAEILALPSVTFSSVKKTGYVVQVEVELEKDPPVRAEKTPLLALCDGVVESVLVLRGTAAVQVGDTVKAGDVLILPQGAEGEVVPVAKVSIRETLVGTLPELILATDGDFIIEKIEGELYTVSRSVIHSIHF